MTLATAPYGFANGREMPIFVYNNVMTTVKNTNRKPIPNINNSFTSACAHFTLCSRLIDNCAEQGRSQKFVLGGYKFLLHNTTVLYTNNLTSSAEISAQNNFQ